jgi:hypothetical protein
MRIATTIFQMLLRIAGLTAIILGLLFWTGNLLPMIPIHMLAGLTVVLSLWILAGLAARAGVHLGLVALAFVWGLIVPILGLTQNQLLPGSWHWVIQVIHLLVGIGALGQGEGLARRIKGAQALAFRPQGVEQRG